MLPEWLVRQRFAMSFMMRGMAVRADAFSEADVERFLAAMRRPGVARAALSYYRAAFRSSEPDPWLVTQRTLVLWANRTYRYRRGCYCPTSRATCRTFEWRALPTPVTGYITICQRW